MSDTFQPFYADLNDQLTVSTENPKGRYLILGIVMNPVVSQPVFVAAHKDSDGRIYYIPAHLFKFRGFFKSCIMCYWPSMLPAEGEKT